MEMKNTIGIEKINRVMFKSTNSFKFFSFNPFDNRYPSYSSIQGIAASAIISIGRYKFDGIEKFMNRINNAIGTA